MGTEISLMVAVSDGKAAIKFYRAGFGATLPRQLDAGGHVVAGLSINYAYRKLHPAVPTFSKAPVTMLHVCSSLNSHS